MHLIENTSIVLEVLNLTKRVLITAALPYANAKPHLGHLRSTYLPADIYSRYNRLKGNEIIYICATDEHGTPIDVQAQKESTSPRKIVDFYHSLIENDLRKMNCSFDYFGRTTFESHYQLTQEFFTSLMNNGHIYRAEYEQLYCSNCDRFLPDRFVEGVCPYCKAEAARGDSCEACGRYLKPAELIDPYCTVCSGKPTLRKTEHWFFKLSSFQEFVEDWIEENDKLPDNVKNYASQWVRDGLRDWCISRDMTWGVPIPVEGVKGKVIYVWFDAPIGYISSTLEWAKFEGNPNIWEKFWKDAETEIVHFIGKDIIYHHAIFWPAMLKAKGDYNLPSVITAGEYLTLEGKKMSKSRGWLVSIEDYLSSFNPDPLRYYLTVAAPLNIDADFSWSEFARRNNDELADILGNFIHRSLAFTHRFFNGKIPEPSDFLQRDTMMLDAIKKTMRSIETSLNDFNFRDALFSILELAAEGNRYFNNSEPWKTIRSDPSKAETCLYVTNQVVKALAVFLESFLPESAQKIWISLGLDGSIHSERWEDALGVLSPGHLIPEPEPIFSKIDESVVNKQIDNLLQKSQHLVDIDLINELDLVVGTVMEVSRIPNSDGALKLSIDIGENVKRQVVACLRESYQGSELVGRQVVILANLKPKMLAGVRSEAMLLAVETEDGFSLLQPDKPVKPGSKIK